VGHLTKFGDARLVCLEQVASRQHADHLMRRGARHYREPADLVMDHVIGGLAEGAVVVDDWFT
jgi:hypothetical protein